ncbi:transposase [uncultured spirochete]|uniref:Transposase n=1 Tax=uncultured spirochete TaxID=156406 RepID=A0A3P3XMB4_9SPIR|nr:transposase [uncultured spirochete]
MGNAKRTYTEEFKRNALEMLKKPGKTGADVARDLGIGSGEINRWRRAVEQEHRGEEKAFPGKGQPRDEELARLQRENRDLKEANEILKKAVAIFSRGEK